MISAAEAVTDELGGRKDGKYRRWLEDTVGALEVQDRSVLEAIAGLGLPIATTNYDGLLEAVTGWSPVTWKDPALVQKALREKPPPKKILHLHGYWEQPESVVLGIRSYEDLLRDEAAQALQTAVGTLKSLIFIGCGAGLEDPNFGALLAWLGKCFSGSSFRHFRLCLDSELDDLRAQHGKAKDRVMPVAYGADHGELAGFLQDLAPPSASAPSLATTSPDAPSAPKPADPTEKIYKTWALDQYGYLHLVGLGAGEVRMPLDEVYVPLRLSERPAALEESGKRRGKAQGPIGFGEDGHEDSLGDSHGDLELEEVFRAAERHETHETAPPHIVLLGDPGSGKTTALRKLLQRCFVDGPKRLGLPEGTLPVLVRLRHLKTGDLGASLGAFLDRDLAETSGGKVPAGFGARLWRRGRLLLLLDGLDEIPDTELRTQVCGYLHRKLHAARKRGVRAIVSCRHAGYGRIRQGSREHEVDLGESFLRVEVRPLGPEQCEDLVRRWFHELPRAVEAVPETKADAAADGLVKALASEEWAAQRLKVLVGSPLLLTLLCVVVWRGGEMPRHRVAFYSECLRVLLGKWGRTEREREPALEVETALDILRSLAYKLHSEERREDLSHAEALLHFRDELKARGVSAAATEAVRVLEWLHREAGVLLEVAPRRYGFLHLGVQEYLTALQVAAESGELIAHLAEHASERWWREVVLLAVGLPHRHVFGPLMKALVGSETLFEQGDLIRACLREASEVDLDPFLVCLEPGGEPRQQAAVLRLLRGRHEPRLREAAAKLLESAQGEVAELARQVVAEADRAGETETDERRDLALVSPVQLLEASRDLAAVLQSKGLSTIGPIEAGALEGQLVGLLGRTRGVAVAVGAGEEVWELPEVSSSLRMLDEVPLVTVRLTGEGRLPRWPGPVEPAARLDLRSGVEALDSARLERILGGAPEALALGEVVGREADKLFIETVTEMRFLYVPGGRFQMGGKAEYDGKPPHWVRISPFWLAETAVTNEQYGRFLAATKHEEPGFWRDRRFSDPEQPVVGVSWHDAEAFCRWLSAGAGRELTLPSEAQWEFAARGEEGRIYPWGDDPPDERRACFDQDYIEGRPAPVGSFPSGQGPFGHQDLAGNVWEWCLDAWDEEAYSKRGRGAEPTDPLVTEGEGELKALRGGGWDRSASDLRSAIRNGDHATGRNDDIGFRLAAVSASTSTS